MVVESEGNGRMCLTLPDVADHGHGHREARCPRWQRPRGLPPAPAALVDRGADEPVHVDVDRRDAGRRPAGVPPRPPRQRPDRHARRIAVGRQALRCIRCSACLNVCPVYERTGGRAYGSPYPGPIGAILTPQLRGHRPAPGRRADGVAPLRLVAVRRLLRRLPRPHRHPRGPRPPPRAGRRAARLDRPDRERGGGDDAGLGLAFRSPGRLATRGARGGRRGPSAGRHGRLGRLRLPGPARRAGSAAATSRRRRASRSGAGGGAAATQDAP